VAAALLFSGRVGGAQLAVPARPVVEGRIDAVAGSVDAMQAGVGVQLPSGTYFRLALIAAGGAAWRDGEQRSSARAEVHARFHLDPYREVRAGLYGIGGLATTWDPFQHWQPRLVIGAGVELPVRGRAGWAIEAALAGGFRMGAVLRAANPDRR